jgi:hypothetical protein
MIEAYKDDPIERPLKGYKLHGEEILSCLSCKTPLVSIIVVKLDCPVFTTREGNINSIKFIANCPKCKSKSLVKRFDRVKLYYQAIEPFSLVDSKLTGNGEEQRCEIELR